MKRRDFIGVLGGCCGITAACCRSAAGSRQGSMHWLYRRYGLETYVGTQTN